MKNEFVTSKNGQKEKNQIQRSKLALFQSQFFLVSNPANRPPTLQPLQLFAWLLSILRFNLEFFWKKSLKNSFDRKKQTQSYITEASIYYEVVISVCLLEWPIIIQEPLDRFALNRKFLSRVQWDHFFRESTVSCCSWVPKLVYSKLF